MRTLLSSENYLQDLFLSVNKRLLITTVNRTICYETIQRQIQLLENSIVTLVTKSNKHFHFDDTSPSMVSQSKLSQEFVLSSMEDIIFLASVRRDHTTIQHSNQRCRQALQNIAAEKEKKGKRKEILLALTRKEILILFSSSHSINSLLLPLSSPTQPPLPPLSASSLAS